MVFVFLYVNVEKFILFVYLMNFFMGFKVLCFIKKKVFFWYKLYDVERR